MFTGVRDTWKEQQVLAWIMVKHGVLIQFYVYIATGLSSEEVTVHHVFCTGLEEPCAVYK